MKQPKWLTEAEASELVGLKPKTLRRYVTEKGKDGVAKLPFSYTRATRRSEPRYDRNSIEEYLISKMVIQ